MSNNKKSPVDTETVLITLDQLGQTIDIMTSVLGRLRNYISEHHLTEESTKQNLNTHTETTTQQPYKINLYKDIEESLKPISTTLH